jgi:hypothetical protein
VRVAALVVGSGESFTHSEAAGDSAYLYGAPAGGNVFVGAPTYSYVSGAGSLGEAAGFQTVVGVAGAGTDSAYLYGAAAGSNAFVSTPAYGYLYGTGYLNQADGFGTVVGVAGAGTDSAYLYGAAAGGNVFIGTPSYSYQYGPGYFGEAAGFQTAVGNAAGAGNSAYLYGSATGANTLTATPSYAYLSGGLLDQFGGVFNPLGGSLGVSTQANGFQNVTAVAGTANDSAYLYGAPAGGNVFVGTPTSSYLSGSGFLNDASGFQTVTGNAAGPGDSAYLYGSAAGGNYLTVTPTSADLSPGGPIAFPLSGVLPDLSGLSLGPDVRADGFQNVTATAGTADDSANLTGVPGNVFTLNATNASLTGGGLSVQVNGFGSVSATSGGGGQAYLNGTGTAADLYSTAGGTPTLSGAGFFGTASGFDSVTVNPNAVNLDNPPSFPGGDPGFTDFGGDFSGLLGL